MDFERRRLERMIEQNVRDQRESNPHKTRYGVYWEKINGVYVAACAADLAGNAQPTEGLNNALDVWLGAVAKTSWYLALYSNAVSPASGWTGANVIATAGENTSETEGYSGATRPQFTPNAAASGHIDNVGQEAVFNIVATTTISVQGVLMLSGNGRGGTGDILGSAARFPLVRTLQNLDVYGLGFRNTITG